MGILSGATGFVGSSSSSQHKEIAQLIKQELENSKSAKEAIEKVFERLGIYGKDKLIVFYGFQGLLANTFSLIETKDQEEAKMRIFALDDSVSPVFMPPIEFYEFFTKYNVPEGTLNPVKFKDAMDTLRIGVNLQQKEAKFEDSEVDEFDDNCNEDCVPGGHTCGK